MGNETLLIGAVYVNICKREYTLRTLVFEREREAAGITDKKAPGLIERDGLCCQPDLHATLPTDSAGAPFKNRQTHFPLGAAWLMLCVLCVTSASNALIPRRRRHAG